MANGSGRIGASIDIVKASWAVLRQDKELLWLPVMSLGATLVTVAIFGGGILATKTSGPGVHPSGIGWVLLFLLYLVLAVIGIFFNAAIVSAAHERLSGGDPTVGSALGGATSRWGVLLPWAIVSATVSTALRAVQERAGLVGRVVVGLVGLAWTLVTFLVLPILVIEGLSVGAAIKRSKELFTRTWGEQVVGNAAVGIIAALAVLPAVPIAVIGLASGVGVIQGATVAICVLWVLAVMAVSTAMSGIFQTALYLYASTGTAPSAYPAGTIEAAFRPKRTRSGFFSR